MRNTPVKLEQSKRIQYAHPRLAGDKVSTPATSYPNQQLITEIEDLMSQVNEKLIELPASNFAKDFNKYAAIGKALEEIDQLKTTLRELKQVFE
jgi:hypothetical protein